MNLLSLLKETTAKGASDLHLVAGISPTIRIDGNLKALEEKSLTPEEIKSLIYSVISAEKIAQFEKSHELDFSFGVSGVGRFRTNVHVQRGSIAVAIRRLPDHIPSLSELHLPSILGDLALKKRGLILVTGPTGCGKSTTLAAMVGIVNEERPAHIIMATLHTPDAPGAVDRCIDVFPPHQQSQIRTQLANTLQAVIAQILLPQKNDRGRVPAVELLLASSAMRNLIRTGKSHQLPTVMETGIQLGMRTMDQALKDLVNRDMVSYETAVVRVRNRTVFEKSLMAHP